MSAEQNEDNRVVTTDEMLDTIGSYTEACVREGIGFPAMNIFQSKWQMHILFLLCRFSPIRFGELKAKIPGISNAVLSTSLKALSDSGLAVRTQYNEVPPHTDYSITEAGIELMHLNYEIVEWEQKYFAK